MVGTETLACTQFAEQEKLEESQLLQQAAARNLISNASKKVKGSCSRIW